jgi:glycerophosphoryl diester phosphodiesterase
MKNMRKTASSKIFFCCVVVMLSVIANVSAKQVDERPMFEQVIAHRGDHKEYPGNTLPAIKSAFELGVDGVEIDVRVSKDGVVVLIHDSSLKRMTGINKEVANLTYAELRKLDFGAKQEKWAVTRIASLKEVLSSLPKGKFLHIEMKDKPERLVMPLIKVVKESGLGPDQIKFTSGQFHNIAGIEKELPLYETFWNGYRDPQEAKAAGFDGIAAFFKEEHAKRVLAAGLQLRIGRANSLEIAKKIKAAGVRIVDTDNPAEMVPLLK